MKKKVLEMAAVILISFSFILKMIGEESVPSDAGPTLISCEEEAGNEQLDERPMIINYEDKELPSTEFSSEVHALHESFVKSPNTLERDLKYFGKYTYAIGFLRVYFPTEMDNAAQEWWKIYRDKILHHNIKKGDLDKTKIKVEEDVFKYKRFDPEMIYKREGDK